VQFFQDKPQLFAKMALPHAFGFLLYRPALDGSASAAAAGAAPAPQPLQLFNTDRDSRHAARRMQELTPLLQQVVGFTPSRQGECMCGAGPAHCQAAVLPHAGF
jgi:hypothetical protein